MRRGRERSTLSERPCGLPLYSEFWEDLVASRCVTFAGTLERRLLTTGQVSRACPLRVRLQQRFRSLFGCLRLPLCVCPLSVECVLVCACVCVFVCLFHANRNATTVPIAATHLPSVCVPATPPNCLCPESAPPLRETATPLPLCCLSTPFLCVCRFASVWFYILRIHGLCVGFVGLNVPVLHRKFRSTRSRAANSDQNGAVCLEKHLWSECSLYVEIAQLDCTKEW